MGKNRIFEFGVSILCSLLLVLAVLTTSFFLYSPNEKRNEIADAWIFDNPADFINVSATGNQIHLFAFNKNQKKIIRDTKISYAEG